MAKARSKAAIIAAVGTRFNRGFETLNKREGAVETYWSWRRKYADCSVEREITKSPKGGLVFAFSYPCGHRIEAASETEVVKMFLSDGHTPECPDCRAMSYAANRERILAREAASEALGLTSVEEALAKAKAKAKA